MNQLKVTLVKLVNYTELAFAYKRSWSRLRASRDVFAFGPSCR